MSTARTICGTVTRIGQPSSTRAGNARAFDDLETELPADGIGIDLDHDGKRRGTLAYLERGADNRVQAVAVLDDAAWIDQLDQPIYFSGRWELTGGSDASVFIARSARLLGLSLTLDPATVAATPVRVRHGDVRRAYDRSTWPLSWRHSNGLLARAADSTGGRADAAARWVVDRRHHEPQYPLDPWTGERVHRTRADANGIWRRGGGYVLSVH